MVGNRLADIRKARDLSKGDMAKALLVSDERYSELESNKYIPNDVETAQMASLLGVSKDFLEAGEYEMRQKNHESSRIVRTPRGFMCTEESCGWRQNCGGEKFYCPGKGCMKDWEERK
jgi:transcriptional regulator with XRE-family HTH domain